jgi:hypothetical protein
MSDPNNPLVIEDQKARAAMAKAKEKSLKKGELFEGKGKGKAVYVSSDSSDTDSNTNMSKGLSDINTGRRVTWPINWENATQTDFFSGSGQGRGNVMHYNNNELLRILKFSEDARFQYMTSGVPAAKREIARLFRNEEVIRNVLELRKAEAEKMLRVKASTSNTTPTPTSTSTSTKRDYESSSDGDYSSKKPKN